MSYIDIFTSHFSSAYYQLSGIFTIYVVATFLALGIEFVVVGKSSSTICKIINGNISKTLRQDIIIWILEIANILTFVGKVITLGATYYLANILNQWVQGISVFKFLSKIPSLPVQIVLFLLFSDFVGYWLHRAFHKHRALWMLHKFHHSASEMTVFNATRDNPIVIPLFVLFTGLPVAIFGAPSEVPLWITFFGIWHALIIHSQISSNWGVIGRWFIVSPHWHTVHHSKSKQHEDKNFSFLFPIWDHVFGTYYSGVEPVSKIGINEPDAGLSFCNQIFKDTTTSISLLLKTNIRKVKSEY